MNVSIMDVGENETTAPILIYFKTFALGFLFVFSEKLKMLEPKIVIS
jgi:hypothetical protein